MACRALRPLHHHLDLQGNHIDVNPSAFHSWQAYKMSTSRRSQSCNRVLNHPPSEQDMSLICCNEFLPVSVKSIGSVRRSSRRGRCCGVRSSPHVLISKDCSVNDFMVQQRPRQSTAPRWTRMRVPHHHPQSIDEYLHQTRSLVRLCDGQRQHSEL